MSSSPRYPSTTPGRPPAHSPPSNRSVGRWASRSSAPCTSTPRRRVATSAVPSASPYGRWLPSAYSPLLPVSYFRASSRQSALRLRRGGRRESPPAKDPHNYPQIGGGTHTCRPSHVARERTEGDRCSVSSAPRTSTQSSWP